MGTNQNESINEISTGTRIVSGLFLVWTDVLFLYLPASLVSKLTSNASVNTALAGSVTILCLAFQMYAAYKGYSISKIISGRQVISKKTHKPANFLIQFFRPYATLMWCQALGMIYVGVTLTAGVIITAFQRKENTVADVMHNRANNAAAAAVSFGLFSYFFYKYPKMTWLYDTLLNTTVVQKPYSEIFADLKFDKKLIQQKMQEFKKAA